MNKTTVIVLRGVSGSGKTTFAKLLASQWGYFVASADDYFTDIDGNYNFDASKLGDAHAFCRKNFQIALNNPLCRGVIVANTNTKESEFSFYENAAKEADAQFFSLIVENRHGNTDVHNVPSFAKENQAKNIMNSIKLI
jgi:uridine kinase